tara:strand:+ start:602 stop:814 length:213 start_codon:yes stop_codon:yes gene_type:complete
VPAAQNSKVAGTFFCTSHLAEHRYATEKVEFPPGFSSQNTLASTPENDCGNLQQPKLVLDRPDQHEQIHL